MWGNRRNLGDTLQVRLRKVVHTPVEVPLSTTHHARPGASLGPGPHGTLMAAVSRSCSVLLTCLDGVR